MKLKDAMAILEKTLTSRVLPMDEAAFEAAHPELAAKFAAVIGRFSADLEPLVEEAMRVTKGGAK